MKLKTVSWRQLEDPIERATARLSEIATGDTIFGGASALVIAKQGYFEDENGNREQDIPKGMDAHAIVSDVYSASTGRASKQHEAWECPECGQVHLGFEAAINCCQETEEDSEYLREMQQEMEERD